jgi:hypothetical protein
MPVSKEKELHLCQTLLEHRALGLVHHRMFWGVAGFCVGVPPNVIQKGVRNGAPTRPIPEALLTFMPGNTK